jgi:hypothetical protein
MLYIQTQPEYYNVALGDSALRDNSTGYSNVALGPDALYVLIQPDTYNVALGAEALREQHNRIL